MSEAVFLSPTLEKIQEAKMIEFGLQLEILYKELFDLNKNIFYFIAYDGDDEIDNTKNSELRKRLFNIKAKNIFAKVHPEWLEDLEIHLLYNFNLDDMSIQYLKQQILNSN